MCVTRTMWRTVVQAPSLGHGCMAGVFRDGQVGKINQPKMSRTAKHARDRQMCIEVERRRHLANFGSHIMNIFKRDGDVKKALGRLEQNDVELLHFARSDCTEVAFMNAL